MTPFGSAFRTLHFAVRPRIIARYLGQMLLVLAVFTAVPALVSLAAGRSDIALRYLALIALFGALGGLGARVRTSGPLQANEALVISASIFALSGVAMALPLTGYGIDPLDAVFESISGVTTTGLSTLGGVEEHPWPLLFARAWMQWLGGLGVVVLALAFMIPSGIAAKRLGFDDREAADFVGGTRGHARRIGTVYLCLTALGVIACVAAGMDGFDALTHTMAAVSTGGFATSDASLAGRGPWVQTVLSLLCLAGAVSFAFYYSVLHRVRARPTQLAAWRSALGDSRLWMLLALTGVGTLVVGLSLAPSTGLLEGATWARAATMAVSAQTTAGFSTVPVQELPAAAKLGLVAGMLVGGEVGSTAGGLKILRVLILAQLVLLRLLRASVPPGTQLGPRIDGKRVAPAEVEAAAALALAYASVLGVSWLAFVAYGHDPLASLFEVVSALSTAGLSSGLSAPELHPLLKGVLCVDMLMGRVEIFAFLVLVFPGTWIGRRRAST